MSTTFKGPVVSTNGFTGNVTGDVTGTLTGNQLMPCATVAAAGSSNSDAAAVALGFTLVTAADDAKGVKLPTAAAGQICIIKNGVSNKILKIYPGASDGINALTVTTGSLDIAAATSVMLIAYDATTWYSLPLLPS
jgi:hypothetical protein